MSKKYSQQYYTLKCLIRYNYKRFIIQRFRFPKILTCQGFNFHAVRGMRWWFRWCYLYKLCLFAKRAVTWFYKLLCSSRKYLTPTQREVVSNLVPRVHRLHGQRLVAWWNSGEMEFFTPEIWGSGCCAHALLEKRKWKFGKKLKAQESEGNSELHSLDIQIVRSSGSTLLWVI